MYNGNIVLIGFMGSGKTTIGRRLAKELKFSFIDCDEEIERQKSITIQEIFSSHGENGFRKIEKEVIENIANKNNDKIVLSTGGGVIKNSENMVLLKSI